MRTTTTRHMHGVLPAGFIFEEYHAYMPSPQGTKLSAQNTNTTQNLTIQVTKRNPTQRSSVDDNRHGPASCIAISYTFRTLVYKRAVYVGASVGGHTGGTSRRHHRVGDCVPTTKSYSTVRQHVRKKNPGHCDFTWISTHVPTAPRLRGYQLSSGGRQADTEKTPEPRAIDPPPPLALALPQTGRGVHRFNRYGVYLIHEGGI